MWRRRTGSPPEPASAGSTRRWATGAASARSRCWPGPGCARATSRCPAARWPARSGRRRARPGWSLVRRVSRLPRVACSEPVWPTCSAGIVAPGEESGGARAGRWDELDVGVPEERDRRLGRPHLGRDDLEHRRLQVERHDDESAGDRLPLAGNGADRHVAVLDRRSEGDGGGRGRQLRVRPPRRSRRRRRRIRARRPPRPTSSAASTTPSATSRHDQLRGARTTVGPEPSAAAVRAELRALNRSPSPGPTPPRRAASSACRRWRWPRCWRGWPGRSPARRLRVPPMP